METKAVGSSNGDDVMRLLSGALGGSLAAADIRHDMSLNQDLGLDSVGFISLVLGIEDCLQRKIFSAVDLGGIHTVGDLLGAVQRSTTS
jgi:acyl carrier protein